MRETLIGRTGSSGSGAARKRASVPRPIQSGQSAANRKRGRMSGQIRMRARYKRYVTPWFDYLMVSPAEMEALLEGTGWRVVKQYQPPGSRLYTAIIERTA